MDKRRHSFSSESAAYSRAEAELLREKLRMAEEERDALRLAKGLPPVAVPASATLSKQSSMQAMMTNTDYGSTGSDTTDDCRPRTQTSASRERRSRLAQRQGDLEVATHGFKSSSFTSRGSTRASVTSGCSSSLSVRSAHVIS